MLRRRAQGRYTATTKLAYFTIGLLQTHGFGSMLVLNYSTSAMEQAFRFRSGIYGDPDPMVLVDPAPDFQDSGADDGNLFLGARAMAPEEYARGDRFVASASGGHFKDPRAAGFDWVFSNACQLERPAQDYAYWTAVMADIAPSVVRRGTVWKHLLDCVTAATCLKDGGKSAVLVPASCLGGELLAPARKALIDAGLIERVILFGQGALEGPVSLVPLTALVVLSHRNESVAVHDVREFDIAELDPSKVVEGCIGSMRVLSRDDLLDRGGMASLDAVVFEKSSERLQYYGRPLGYGDTAVFLGTSLDSAASGSQDGHANARILKQADLVSGLTLSEPVALSEKDYSTAFFLREGDIVLTRVSVDPIPVLVEGLDRLAEGFPVAVTKSHVVVRYLDRPYRDECACLAAMLSGKGVLTSAVVGGRTKHLGIKELRKLPVLPLEELVEQGYAERYRKRVADVRKAYAALLDAQDDFDALRVNLSEMLK